jgi:hypothetical protein
LESDAAVYTLVLLRSRKGPTMKASTLKDKTGAEPTTADISATRSSAVTYCQTVGKPDLDSKISEAPPG